MAAVIDYLRHLTIRFHDGGGQRGGRGFRLRVRDPFHADVAPDWLLNAQDGANDLTAAVLGFVDRHEKHRLRRHATLGNINGMENFLDIFTALVRLLYVYHRRGVVSRHFLIGRIINYVKIATFGSDTETDPCDGYLNSIAENLNDADCLQKVCTELNFLGNVRAAFVLVQRIRFVPNEKVTWGPTPTRPRECLPDRRKQIRELIQQLGLKEPSRAEIRKAFEDYKMLTQPELAELEQEISI